MQFQDIKISGSFLQQSLKFWHKTFPCCIRRERKARNMAEEWKIWPESINKGQRSWNKMVCASQDEKYCNWRSLYVRRCILSYFEVALNDRHRSVWLGRKDLAKGIADLQHWWIFQSWCSVFLEGAFAGKWKLLGSVQGSVLPVLCYCVLSFKFCAVAFVVMCELAQSLSYGSSSCVCRYFLNNLLTYLWQISPRQLKLDFSISKAIS